MGLIDSRFDPGVDADVDVGFDVDVPGRGMVAARTTRCARRVRSIAPISAVRAAAAGAPVWPMFPTAGAPFTPANGVANLEGVANLDCARGAGSQSGCARSHAVTLPRINNVRASCLMSLPFRPRTSEPAER
jgi:hypothetical protein